MGGSSTSASVSRRQTRPSLSASTAPVSIVGQGEWAATSPGDRAQRGWKKLHIGVDGNGTIVPPMLTDGTADDAKTGLQVIKEVAGDIACVTADATYDTVAIYEAARVRNAIIVVSPTRTARSPGADHVRRLVIGPSECSESPGGFGVRRSPVIIARAESGTRSSGTKGSSRIHFALVTSSRRRRSPLSRARS